MDSYKVFPAGNPDVDVNGTYGYAVLPDGFRQMPVYADNSLMVGRYPGGQDFYFYPNVPERGVLYPVSTRPKWTKWDFPENAEDDDIYYRAGHAPHDPFSFGSVAGNVLYPSGAIAHNVYAVKADYHHKPPRNIIEALGAMGGVEPAYVHPGFKYAAGITPISQPPKSGIDYHYKMAGYYPPRPKSEWSDQPLLDALFGVIPY